MPKVTSINVTPDIKRSKVSQGITGSWKMQFFSIISFLNDLKVYDKLRNELYYCCLRSGLNIIDFLFSKVASDKNTKFTSRCRGHLNGYIMNKNSRFIYLWL